MVVKKAVDVQGWGVSTEVIPVCSECDGRLGMTTQEIDGDDEEYGVFVEYVDEWKFCPYCGVSLACETGIEDTAEIDDMKELIKKVYGADVAEGYEEGNDYEDVVRKEYGEDFVSDLADSCGSCAFTLSPDYLKADPEDVNGWLLLGDVKEDYFEWINEFEAFNPKFGRVWGNFELTVYADSEEGYQDFVKYFPPNSWGYGDI
jgi:hypothetical protein